MANLEGRAAEIRARNKVLRSVPGSGHHDTDTDVWGRLRASHMRHGPGGQLPGSMPAPPIDEHLVVFHDARDFVFVGEDASKAKVALDAYAEAVKAKDVADMTGTERTFLSRIWPRLLVKDAELRVWREDWNDVLHALEAMTVGVTGAPYADQ